MNDIERIYSLLLHSNGLKIRAISQELELDKYYVAEIMFSSQNIPYWYQDDDSLWYAKEGALQIEEPEEEIDELITPVEIPQRFNVNRFLEEDLSDSLRSYLSQISKYRIYSNDEMIELFKRYRNGDQKAFDLIIKSQQRLVANIAFLYCRKGAPLEDIIQEGNVGLVKAAERFDYTQYRSFSNYAKSWILQSISASMTTMPYMVRLPLNQLLLYRKVRKFKEKFEQKHGYSPSVNDIEIDEELDTERIKFVDSLPYNLGSLTSLFSDLDNKESETNAIDDFINKNESKITIKNLLKRLCNRERQIIQRFYGINAKEETLSAIGDYFGLTRERARQIKEKTVKHLRDILYKRKGVDDKKIAAQEEDEEDIPENVSKIPETTANEEKPEIEGAVVGDTIVYDAKRCTVIEKKTMRGSLRLVVKYENGTIDNLQNDRKRYKIVSSRDEDVRKEINRTRIEKKKRSKYDLTTSLDFLVEEKIITRRQLHQCHKKKLRTIGDVKQIIEKYQLTPYSTRFTKYTLDMWFSIVGLLNKS